MEKEVELAIQTIVNRLKEDQQKDGSWDYCFETGVSTDAYMIILLRTLELHDEMLIKKLVNRIVKKQEENGSWKLFYDEKEGNLSATVEALDALLFSGYCDMEDKNLKKAKQFIIANGGLSKVSMFTKVMLALTGQFKWPKQFLLPIEIILLPTWLPVDYFDFSVYARVNLTPILLAADKRFSLTTKYTPNIANQFKTRGIWEDEAFLNRKEQYRSLLEKVHEGIQTLIGFPSEIHRIAIKEAERYMLERIEADGTFYSYFSSTFLMIFALVSLGYSKTDPLLIKAIKGLKAFACKDNDETVHIQYTTANVWNTALLSDAVQKADLEGTKEMIKKANRYLRSRQHIKYGDWILHNPYELPGGWGFSAINTMNPDIDDTTAALRAIFPEIKADPLNRSAWNRGLRWILSMQNDDGGWPSFERNVNNKLVTLLPVEGDAAMLLDPSTADLTGRTLEFLGNYANLSIRNPSIKKAVKWLKDHQTEEGSWYGRWGICYIYGTWAAITGMRAVGVGLDDSTITRAIQWLKSIQNKDGGWGESCYSDKEKRYIPLEKSTLPQTAWAVEALITASEDLCPEIEKGVTFIAHALKEDSWTWNYPTGSGLPGGFYIHYHSYRYVWPLLALTRYRNKFLSRCNRP